MRTVTLRERNSSGERSIRAYGLSWAASRVPGGTSGNPSLMITTLSGARMRPRSLTRLEIRETKALKSV